MERVFDWRRKRDGNSHAFSFFQREVERKTGQPLLVFRGDTIDRVQAWGTINPDEIAVPEGSQIDIDGGDVEIVGPATARDVLEAVLQCQHERTPRPANVVGCARCPVEAFCGFERLGSGPGGSATPAAFVGGTTCFKSLWSKPFCHKGLTGVFLDELVEPEWLSPENAANFGTSKGP